MHLLSIGATAFKGRDFDDKLSNSVAIIGPNFSGKTARIEALRLLFKGYIPEIGKLAKATWELASNGAMEVFGVFDNGMVAKRAFREMEGVIKSDNSLAHPGTENCELSWEMLTDIPLLDAAHYFSLTDRERIDYVFAAIPLPATYSKTKVIASCEQVSFGEEHTEDYEHAKVAVIKVVKEAFGSLPIQDALTAALVALKTKFSYWNGRAKETVGAVTTITELKLREGEASADTLRQLEAEGGEAQKAVNQAIAKVATLKAQKEAGAATAARITTLQGYLGTRSHDYDPEIAELDKTLTKYRDGEEDMLGKLLSHVDRAELDGRIAKSNHEIGVAERKIDGLKETIESGEEQKLGLEGLEACPTCKSTGKGWKANLKKYLTKEIGEAKKELAVLRSGLEKEKADLAKMALRRLEDVTLGEEIAKLGKTIADLANRREGLRVNRDNQARNLAAWKKELSETEKGAVPTEEEIMEAAGERTAAQEKVTAIDLRKTAATRLAQDLKRAAEAEKEHLISKAYVAVINAITAVIRGVKSTMVEEVFGGLLATAHEMVGQILPTPLAFHQGTVGRWEGTKFVTHRTFSGTEKALTYIAIATALSVTAPIKLVILDEFDRLDEGNKRKLIKTFCDLVRDKKIDQFIIVGTQPLPVFEKQPEYILDVIRTKAA